VVFHESTPDAVREALRPLLELRRAQAGNRYKEFEGLLEIEWAILGGKAVKRP
jgi:hypothetical protein